MATTNWEEVARKELKVKEKDWNQPWFMPVKPRIVVYGNSGSGKTNTVVEAIMSNYIDFDKIWIFLKDLECDHKWRYVMKHFFDLEKAYEKKYGKKIDLIEVGTELEDMPKVNDLDENRKHLIIIDDFVTEGKHKQKQVEDLFIRGRKRDATTMYLTQDYFKTPTEIRKNATMFWLHSETNGIDRSNIAKDVSARMPLKNFLKLYDEIMDSSDFPLMVIDKDAKKQGNKLLYYRKGFNCLLTQERYNELMKQES